jgi:hypothetical protein
MRFHNVLSYRALLVNFLVGRNPSLSVIDLQSSSTLKANLVSRRFLTESGRTIHPSVPSINPEEPSGALPPKKVLSEVAKQQQEVRERKERLKQQQREYTERYAFLESIVAKEDDLREIFTRGSGPGGQSVNKSRNCVQLTHLPTGLSVSCHETRDLTTNRKIARKKLVEQLDVLYYGKESKKMKEEEKIRRRKARAKR